MTGDLVNAYIDMQLCEMERRLPGKAGGKDVKIPKEAKAIEEQYPVADIPKVSHYQIISPSIIGYGRGYSADNLRCSSINNINLIK